MVSRVPEREQKAVPQYTAETVCCPENSEPFSRQPGRFWGYAYLRPRSEKAAAADLAAAGIMAYLPLLPKARLHHGTKVVTYCPMIAGYIFLCASEQERSDLKRENRHIIQIELQREPFYEDMLIAELNVLHRFERIGRSEPVVVNPGIQPGDRVIITNGSLKGLETVVIRRDDDRDSIVVNLTLLNKSVEYPVAADVLKKMTE